MEVVNELITFFEFVTIGIIISIIFDFFRAFRKIRKTSTVGVLIQDIIFFFIATLIITVSIITMLDSNIRVYVFFAIIIGCMLYLSILTKLVLKFEIFFLKQLGSIIYIFILPILVNIEIFKIICKFSRKNVKKCCKKFFYMLSLICKSVKFFKNSFKRIFKLVKFSKKSRTKEGLKYEKSI